MQSFKVELQILATMGFAIRSHYHALAYIASDLGRVVDVVRAAYLEASSQ